MKKRFDYDGVKLKTKNGTIKVNLDGRALPLLLSGVVITTATLGTVMVVKPEPIPFIGGLVISGLSWIRAFRVNRKSGFKFININYEEEKKDIDKVKRK